MINVKRFKSVGIIGFGAYIPFQRIKVSEIAKNWQKEGKEVQESLGIYQKAAAGSDEDCLTMAVEASLTAIRRAKIDPQKIGAVFVGSESHPYTVKPTGTILAGIMGLKNEYFCADLEFACKAGTAGLQIVAAMIEAGMIDYGLVVGSDKAQAKPGDALEYTAAAGAAAFILGGRQKEFAAQLISTYSFSSDTPDFWRRAGSKFPVHTARFTGEPGYFYHLSCCLDKYFQKIKKPPNFFDHVVFHMPNKKFPLTIAKKYGISQDQLKEGLLVTQIGNTYSASSLLGLVSVLEQAKNNQNILLASYGSGAGSDVFWWQTRKNLKLKTQNSTPRGGQAKLKTIKDYLDKYEEIDYLTYLRNYNIF